MALSPLATVRMPSRIAKLARDERGFPVPWFVPWIDRKPVFPCFDEVKFARAVSRKCCWVCGEPLGKVLVFVVGPMCTMNRVSAEPPSHLDCARYSVQVCPFLSNPAMRRVPLDKINGGAWVLPPGGTMLPHNPGVMALWVAGSYRVINTDTGAIVRMGNPTGGVTWWTRGRIATPAEAAEAFSVGAGRLLGHASREGDAATVMCGVMIRDARKLLPDPDLVREVAAVS